MTFRFKSHVDSLMREKTYKSLTLHTHQFMVRMLFFSPDRHEISIRY